MMCHGFVRSLILYFYALKPSLLESSQIQMDMSSYLVKSDCFPWEKIKYDSRIHDFMFDNSRLRGELRWPRRVTHAN